MADVSIDRDFINDNNAATCPISHCDFIDPFLPSSAAATAAAAAL